MLTQKKKEEKKEMDPPNKTKFVGQPFFLTEKKLHPPIFFYQAKKKIFWTAKKLGPKKI